MSDSRASEVYDESVTKRRAAEGTAPVADPGVQHPVLRLQRTLGNARVARMLGHQPAAGAVQAKHDPALAQRESEGGEAEEEELQAKHDPAIAQRESEGGEAEEEELQAKHDPALAQRESEGAEAEEEELQAKHDPAIAQREAEGGEAEEEELQAKHDPAIAQRESEGSEAEEEELQAKHDPALQRKAQVGLEGGDVSDDIASRIQAKRGGGSALESTLQSKMEGAMGTSFKDVRIHRDAESDTLNRSITAKAFTTGSDIFLREDQNPNDSSLLAHELTHVVQQRSMSSGGRMSVGAHDNSYEQQADSVAKAVTSGSTPQRIADDANS